MSLTVLQKTNADGLPKPGELIEITGAHGLEALDRAILNTLYQHAHDAGNITDAAAEWEIPLHKLRPSSHESNDRLRDALKRLASVIIEIPFIDPENGDPRFLITTMFDFFDVPAEAAVTRPTLRYGLARKMGPLLARSNRWGRIKAEIVCAMSSRYAIALYEMIQLRAHMDRCVETFPIERFRALLGVPPETYKRGPDFTRFVLQPAELEVNGLSDMGVKIDVKRRSPRSPIEGVTVAWWRKSGEPYRETLRERQRSKLGRSARLRGQVEDLAASQSAEKLVIS